MSQVAVVTDSTVSLPESLLDSLHIRTVAYYLHRGREVLRDLITIQRDEFLKWLPTARVAPTTAAPGPGDYLEAYEELIRAGADEIISIHMGSKLSAAYESATAATGMLKEKHPEVRVEVIDSRNAALCQGWMAVEAARRALAGANLQTIAAAVRRLVPISHMIQTADTLRYLYPEGIGKAQNLLGSIASSR
jgi:DegV family protein with EDD domain